MAKLFAKRVLAGKIGYANVPARLKEAVAKILIEEYIREDLVVDA